MPRIEPIPVDELADESRRIIEEGTARGLYATPVPLQIFAYQTSRLAVTDSARQVMGQRTLLGARIHVVVALDEATERLDPVRFSREVRDGNAH